MKREKGRHKRESNGGEVLRKKKSERERSARGEWGIGRRVGRLGFRSGGPGW